jgi:hypothetical protein
LHVIGAIRRHKAARWAKTHNVVETLGSTETSRSHANDEDINVAAANSLDFNIIGKADTL